MRILKRILLLLLVILIAFVAYTLISTGYFRKIKPMFDGEIIKKVAVVGAEDIMVSHMDSFALISSTDRALSIPRDEQEGEMYWMDLKTNRYEPVLLTADFDQPFAPHGIYYYKKDSSYTVMVISHAEDKHSIEVFDLQGSEMKHVKTLKDASMLSPNDIFMLDENRFYFTNDHGYTKGMGKIVEEYGGLSVSNVIYFDGKDYKEVASGIAYANGINYDEKRNLMFVASPRKFLVKVYSRNDDGSLQFIENIPCGTGVDNIEFDEEGNLWIGCHPSLMTFAAYMKDRKNKISPSEIIKINYRGKGDYDVEKVYVEKGDFMSASTVAATFGNKILVGNVTDDEFLVLQRNGE